MNPKGNQIYSCPQLHIINNEFRIQKTFRMTATTKLSLCSRKCLTDYTEEYNIQRISRSFIKGLPGQFNNRKKLKQST